MNELEMKNGNNELVEKCIDQAKAAYTISAEAFAICVNTSLV